jgi:hypothetical protein
MPRMTSVHNAGCFRAVLFVFLEFFLLLDLSFLPMHAVNYEMVAQKGNPLPVFVSFFFSGTLRYSIADPHKVMFQTTARLDVVHSMLPLEQYQTTQAHIRSPLACSNIHSSFTSVIVASDYLPATL